MSEFIGSHISLISKSDIRYIGTLHEINSESSTVALENVRSYGTEGRRGNPSEDIPGSDQVYEYIVFRGSDVKELSIVEAPKENKLPAVPNDPAILGSARPLQPQQGPPQPQHNQHPQFQQPPHFQQQYDFTQGPPPPHFQQPPPRFQNAGGPHGFPGQPGAVPGYNPGFGPPPNFGYGPPGPGFPNGPPGPYNPAQAPIAPPAQQRQQQPGKSDGPQQMRSNNAQRPAEMSATPTPVSASHKAPPPAVESKPTDTTARSAATQAVASSDAKPSTKKASNNRVAVPLPASATKPPPKSTTPATKAPSASKPQSYADATQAATAAVAAAMAQLNPGAPKSSSNAGLDNLTQKVDQMRVQDSGMQRGRGRGRGTGPPRGGRRDQRGVEVPKEDFDFASSNAKFNKQDLVKEAIASGSPVASPGPETEDVNGLENGHADSSNVDDVVIPPKPSAEKSYDKKASFFDNLSSDLRDRTAKHDVDGRALRNQERSKNVETFGQGSVDSGRGGFRGRGRGRGLGRGRGSAGAAFAARGAFVNAATGSADETRGRGRRDQHGGVVA